MARFCSRPLNRHWTALKRVLRYPKGTIKCGIVYQNNGSDQCVGYSDADWIGQATLLIENLLPVTCSCKVKEFFLGAAKKQKTVALSTAEAEYLALSAACQECLWLRQLSTELDSRPVGPSVLYENNQAAIVMTKNPQYGWAKHIDN